MALKADQMRAAIASCEACFQGIRRPMRTVTERVEELWFEIDDRIEALESAERMKDPALTETHLRAIQRNFARIHHEMPD